MGILAERAADAASRRSALTGLGRRAFASFLRSLLRARSKELTATPRGWRTLVIAPHPDDESLGCGATIAARRLAGGHVRVLVASDGAAGSRDAAVPPARLAARRRVEMADACRALGIESVVHLDLPDGDLASVQECLADALRAAIETWSPDEILLPSRFDGHADHHAVNQVGWNVVKALARPVTILEYPVWFWEPYSWYADAAAYPAKLLALIWRPWICITAGEILQVTAAEPLNRKRQAIRCHRSQLEESLDPNPLPVLDRTLLDHFLGRPEWVFKFSMRPNEQSGKNFSGIDNR